MLPDEFDWSLGPPRPRAVQEDHRGQMVPIAAVNDLIEPFLQQQDERWQDEIGCAVIPLMSKYAFLLGLNSKLSHECVYCCWTCTAGREEERDNGLLPPPIGTRLSLLPLLSILHAEN